jgi:hypothetical protein
MMNTPHTRWPASTRPSRRGGFTIFFAVLVGSLALAIGLSVYELLVRELELSQVATQSQFAIYAADAGAECALYWDTLCTQAGCLCADGNAGACTRGSAFATSSEVSTRNPSSGITCTALSTGATSPHDVAANGRPSSIVAPPTLPPLTTPPRLTTAAGNTVPQSGWATWSEIAPAADSLGRLHATTTFVLMLPSPDGVIRTTSPCAKVTVGKNEPAANVPSKTTIISQGYNTCADQPGMVRVERTFQVSY